MVSFYDNENGNAVATLWNLHLRRAIVDHLISIGMADLSARNTKFPKYSVRLLLQEEAESSDADFFDVVDAIASNKMAGIKVYAVKDGMPRVAISRGMLPEESPQPLPLWLTAHRSNGPRFLDRVLHYLNARIEAAVTRIRRIASSAMASYIGNMRDLSNGTCNAMLYYIAADDRYNFRIGYAKDKRII